MILRPSPNFDERGETVSVLVLHYTGMPTAQSAIELLCSPASKVSSHYVVDEDGAVYGLVPEEKRAWHAGISYWRGQRLLNGASVGIEIVNPGHEWGYRPFPGAQMAAVRELCLGILARHPIPPRNVVAHSDIAPNRKQDPGELFDWQGLARAGIGVWTDDFAPPGDWRADLAAIGYDLSLPEDDVIRAFQRHFLPEALGQGMTGQTAARAAALRALVDRD
ncbi:N-acetylmuramoyl-L-alanine amidase [Acidocella sp. KAb 2-4]|uniref:N-acetylmuramoyl-L-alanine amidase n=1 Tax=Acidocella sp. KAb 2-4 TaxID=2885158 RepID=UPI001D067445|nr:N-acetylmuramoyl-L-alanine amidase [Acidocella sp. KAb 2-4]MCB5945107.1 N-acetylmuramoyl-L-alanine amidase [Acidocella sp. KAb 2-4]